MTFIDLTGKRYGMWAVLRRAENNKFRQVCWLCRCDCGNIRSVVAGSLLSDVSRSCGCLESERISKMRTVNEVGNRHGRLVVLARDGVGSKKTRVKWICQCDCGAKKTILGTSLRNGNTRSCGCLDAERRACLPNGEATFNKIYYDYVRGAKKRGFEWQVTKQEFRDFVGNNCFYCGAEPSQSYGTKGSKVCFIYNGIDRVDSARGYVLDNVVPCCRICNFAKQDKTQGEFKDWLIRAYNHWASKGREGVHLSLPTATVLVNQNNCARA